MIVLWELPAGRDRRKQASEGEMAFQGKECAKWKSVYSWEKARVMSVHNQLHQNWALKESCSRNSSEYYGITPLPSRLFSFLGTCVVASTLKHNSQPGKTPPPQHDFSRASVPSWKLPQCFNWERLNFNGKARSREFSRTNNLVILYAGPTLWAQRGRGI